MHDHSRYGQLDEASDFALPLLDLQNQVTSPWPIEQEPLNLIVLWPHRYAPGLQEIIAALRRERGDDVRVIAQPQPDANMRWLAVVELHADEPALVIWCEPMRQLPTATINFLQAQHIKWVIGIETILDRNDPLAHSVKLSKLLAKAFSKSPAFLNVNTELWHLRRDLDELITSDVEIDEPYLIAVHAIGGEPGPDGRVWVYTRGLTACGLPELEMLDVPMEHSRNACPVLTSIAALVIEQGIPAPGEPMEIGPEMFVTFQPWREVAKYIDKNTLGSLKHRELHTEEKATGVRAAVCGAEPMGSYREIWTWPSEVISKVVAGEAPIFLTKRATLRLAQLARSTWSELAASFDSLQPQQRRDGEHRQAVFLLQGGFVIAAPPTHPTHLTHLTHPPEELSQIDVQTEREHLWFEALEFQADRARVRLLNEPAIVSGLHKDDELWLDRDSLSNWLVQTPQGQFGPSNLSALQESLASLRPAL